jgi:hypothetical protein
MSPIGRIRGHFLEWTGAESPNAGPFRGISRQGISRQEDVKKSILKFAADSAKKKSL